VAPRQPGVSRHEDVGQKGTPFVISAFVPDIDVNAGTAIMQDSGPSSGPDDVPLFVPSSGQSTEANVVPSLVATTGF